MSKEAEELFFVGKDPPQVEEVDGKFCVHARAVANCGDGREEDIYLHDNGCWYTTVHRFNSKVEAELELLLALADRLEHAERFKNAEVAQRS